jgi:hypothetical protein
MPSFLKRLFSSKKTPEIRITSQLVVNDEPNPAREKLKEATALKREKRFLEACEKLREAYSAEGAENLMVKELLRLPMYLQLAGRGDEAWSILNEMNLKHLDVFSQAEIADQMRVFLEKEKKYVQALLFLGWSICKEVERDRSNIQSSLNLSDQMARMKREYSFLDQDQKVYGQTPSGNPIVDPAYEMFTKRVEQSTSFEGVKERFGKLLKKAKKESCGEQLSAAISDYLREAPVYDIRELREVIEYGIGAKDA